ncbi:MAG: FHA domain-containing protein [Planctomycetota bacterium]
MLFLSPHPPVLVPRARALVLGRVADCDLPIPSREASRKHARVYLDGDQVMIRDLESTNGTFVNGTRIEEARALRPGDSIRIGEAEVVFCRVTRQSEPAATLDDDATVVCEAPVAVEPRGELLRGDLSQIPVAALLQMLADEQMTGSVAFLSDEISARLWLEDGMPIHARIDDLLGLDAAIVICGLRQGRFLCAEAAELPDQTIEMTAMELLLEASRQADESEAGVQESSV